MVEEKVTLPECNKLRFLYFKRTKGKQRNPTRGNRKRKEKEMEM